MISFAGVALIGVIPGVFIAVAVSLLEFIRRAWRPHDAVLGRADGVKGYHDLTYYPEARQVPGLILYRFDAPLFFANADVFRERIRERIASRTARSTGSSSPPSRSPMSTRRPRPCSTSWSTSSPSRRHHARVRGAEGPHPRQAPSIRRARARPGRSHLPDGRHRRHRLPEGHRPVLDRLGTRHPRRLTNRRRAISPRAPRR